MKRSEVPLNQTWDLGLIYPNPQDAWRDAEELKKLADKVEEEYKGKLSDAGTILDCLHMYEKMNEIAVKVSHYFELDMDTDYTNSEKVTNANKAESILTDCMTKTSFIESEIVEADGNVLEEAIREGGSV